MTSKPAPLGPLIAIVGPTASGKSALALQIALASWGEIVCADSRTVYRGMDIGTAKPTASEQALVRHHLLDLLPPNQPYSAAQFKADALGAITDIHARGKLPILVGGTGLYINAILYDYRFPAGSSNAVRHQLERLPRAELVARLQQVDPERAAAVDLRNPRRVIRAIETAGLPRLAPKTLPGDARVIGLNPGLAELEQRIATRTRQMLTTGLVEEVQTLLRRFDPIIEPLHTIGYTETIAHLHEEITAVELESQINLHTRQLAKRQVTWFKRNPDIHWVSTVPAGLKLAASFIAEYPSAV
jgi:tRNA dimethylallyltransferase